MILPNPHCPIFQATRQRNDYGKVRMDSDDFLKRPPN